MADNWQLKAVLSANAESMLRTLKTVNQATRTTRKYLLDVGKSATNLAAHVGMPLGLISGALGAFSVAGIKAAVSNFAELGDQTVKAAQGLSMSTDEYQRLKYIAGQSGVSVEGLSGSMGRLNKNIALAASGGNKDLAALFKRAEISMRDANGQMRSSSDLLPEVADLFERNKNAAVQARMGNAIFGKGWQELAPLLQGGKKGITELNERYKMLGLTMDRDALKAGEAFGDKMDDLNQVTRSYANTISSKLIPLFSPLLESTIKWAVANRELITTKVSKFIADMATELAKVDWAGVIKGVGDFVNGLKDFVGWIGGAKNALIALVVVMNLQTIAAAFALVGAVGRLGLAFLGLAGKALAPIAPLQTLTAGLTGAKLQAVTLTNTMGKLSAAIGIAGAAWVGWEIGTLLNDHVVNPTVRALTGDKNQTLGGWIYDKTHPDPTQSAPQSYSDFLKARPDLAGGMSGQRPSLITGQQVKASGRIQVDFNNAPPGMRVAQTQGGGDIPINTDVGYSSDALGMP